MAAKSGVGAYGVVNVRVRVAVSEFLSAETLAKLETASGLKAFVLLLNDTVYGPLVSKLNRSDGSDINARHIAYQIRKRVSEKFMLVKKYSPENVRPLIDHLFRIYEIDNLKVTFRGIQLGDSWEKIRYLLFPMGEFDTLPYQEMTKTRSVEQAIELTRGSSYYDSLSLAKSRYTKEASLFPLEVLLDLEYWQKAWELANALPGIDGKISRELIGEIIERNDLIWASRYKTFHHLSVAEIINYTLGIGPKVQDDVIRQIANGVPLSEIIPKIYPSLAVVSDKSLDEVRELSYWEVMLQRMFRQHCRSKLVGSPFNLGGPLAYLFLLEYEIQDLTLLIEAKSLGLPKERYNPFLVNNPVSQPMRN